MARQDPRDPQDPQDPRVLVESRARPAPLAITVPQDPQDPRDLQDPLGPLRRMGIQDPPASRDLMAKREQLDQLGLRGLREYRVPLEFWVALDHKAPTATRDQRVLGVVLQVLPVLTDPRGQQARQVWDQPVLAGPLALSVPRALRWCAMATTTQ